MPQWTDRASARFFWDKYGVQLTKWSIVIGHPSLPNAWCESIKGNVSICTVMKRIVCTTILADLNVYVINHRKIERKVYRSNQSWCDRTFFCCWYSQSAVIRTCFETRFVCH
jgi:hypothetical protein